MRGYCDNAVSYFVLHSALELGGEVSSAENDQYGLTSRVYVCRSDFRPMEMLNWFELG